MRSDNRWCICGSIVRPGGEVRAGTVWVEGTRIESVEDALTPAADVVVEAGLIAPGYVDLQLNGAFGHDLTGNPESAVDIAGRLPARGCTAFLPTLVCTPLERYAPLAATLAAERQRQVEGAEILGLHVEGPIFNPDRAGAHFSGYIRPADRRTLETLLALPDVALVTLAPELPGAAGVIDALVEHGIVVSAGHSQASALRASLAFKDGVTAVTHLFNAMSGSDHRAPGLVAAALASDVVCGLIVDGLHVDPIMVRLAYRAKGWRQLALVTDAMMAAGVGDGVYQLGDQAVEVHASEARLADGTLAGSTLTLDQAVRNMIAFAGCQPAEAIAMASETPARLLGLARKGRLTAGADADIIVLDQALNVRQTWTRGRLAFQVTE
jgi:N-acetylglucosamine-6-phosphate deacetylase